MTRDVATMFDELKALADRHAELHADRARLEIELSHNVTVHVPPGRMQPIDSPMIFTGLAWRGGLPIDSVCDLLGTWNPKTNLT